MKYGDKRALNASVGRRSDVTTVFLHWFAVAALAFALITGLRVAADSESASWSRAVDFILLQGSVTQWHIWTGYALFALIIGYLVFMLRAQLTSRISFDRHRRAALSSTDASVRWQARNVFLFWLGFGLIIALSLTGILMYWAPTLIPHEILTTVHRVLAWGVILYVVLHVVGQIAYGGVRQLLKILSPRLAYGAAGSVAVVVAGAVGAVGYFGDHAALTTLSVAKTDTAPTLDGTLNDAAWAKATPVVVKTTRGINAPGGEVPVTVRALHDGTAAYFAFEWPDATRSMKFLPLVKTDKGWQLQQTEYDIEDEDSYYEDKFAVMFAATPMVAGGTAHTGKKPLDGKPAAYSGRGLHYTTDGSIADVWHWKGARTGNSLMNQIDDNYFGPPMEPTAAQTAGKARYTGGYTQDPNSGGGYVHNFIKVDGKSYAEAVQPRQFPKDWALAKAAIGTDSLDVNSSDKSDWWLKLEDTVKYTPELDAAVPVGTILPGVLVSSEWKGDRGDVAAYAKWDNGVWRMETRRLLNTGSKFDQPFRDGLYMWVSVFQHAQTRHSYHTRPLQLKLAQ